MAEQEKVETNVELQDCRVTIMMSKSELAAIEDWRADRRIWSRGEAIRRLVAAGMAGGDGETA
jgi:hypothetical protein